MSLNIILRITATSHSGQWVKHMRYLEWHLRSTVMVKRYKPGLRGNEYISWEKIVPYTQKTKYISA